VKRQHIIGVSSAKTEKGEALGYLTGICYLSPADTAGIVGLNVCPWAGNCKKICLNTAGRGAFSSVQKGRRRKTVLWAENKRAFIRNAALDIAAVVRKANREGMTPCIRMDGTSDLGIALTRGEDGERLVDKFQDVQFYDYTKSFTRMRQYLRGEFPSNYHLTFSHDGETNYRDCKTVLSMGGNVAVVFRKTIPTEWAGVPVVDGDTSDLRFLDPKGGVIVGLKAKGKAKKDSSGFVVDIA
jgi:hypothetical protein